MLIRGASSMIRQSPISSHLRMLSSSHLPGLFEGKRVLTVGEGDLGFSAALARQGVCTSLTASTWDTKAKLFQAYENAERNVGIITNTPSSNVVYEQDATQLKLDGSPYDVVLWNFPHVPGKANNKWNRVLLDNYFAAAKSVLSEDGKCIVTLCPDQSGWHARTHRQWLHSWKLAHAAAENGFVVSSMQPFDVDDPAFRDGMYYPMGHRGSGGRFSAFQGRADLFILQQAQPGISGLQAPLYAHEIHVNAREIANIEWLEEETRKSIAGICSKDGDLRDILRGSDPLWSVHVVDIYMCPRTGLVSHALEISYCSTSCAVGREAADKIRKEVELQLPHHLNMARREHVVDAGKEREHAEEGEWYTLRREKIGGRVSQPYFWQVAQVKAGMTNTSHGQLSVALSEVEKQGQAEPTLWLLSDDNLGKSGSCGGGDPDVELIRAMARKLWRRRLGVLIRDVDLSSGVDLPEEDEGGLISSIRRVEEVEAEAEASDGEFLRETDDEMEVKTSSAEQDSTTGQYSLYLLEHSHSGRTYAGVTVDLSRRIQQHNGVLKGGAKYTAAFRGQSGLWEYAVCLEGLSHSRALRLEAAIKKESRRLPPAKEVGVSRAKQRADLILSLVEDSERKRIRVMNL